MSDSEVNDAFLKIIALPQEARTGEVARLEQRSPEIATEVRTMLLHYREEPEDPELEDAELDDDRTREREAPDAVGTVETFATPGFVDRRSGAPRIPGHRIVEPIDHGGQSTVYLAEQSHPRRLVAVKVLRLAILDPRARERFLAEAQLQGTIRHPAIVGIHASGVADDTGRPLPWISMELVPGARTISEAAHADGWDRRRRIQALATVAEAIHAAHLRGVVHRDLKPGNILVDADGRVRIIDFGIARLLDAADGESLTRAGELVGTIRYLAPEQLRGGQIDARADIHALGVLAFELLHECSPWGEATSTSTIIAAIERHEIAFPRARGRTDRDLRAVLARALAAEPADRYESMAAFARDLRSLAAGNRVDARSNRSVDEIRRFAARHPLPMWLSVMLLVAILVALVDAVRFTSETLEMRARGLVSQINAAVARGDLQMARTLLDRVPAGNRGFEYHLLAAEARPSTIGRRPAWASLGNLYELERVPGTTDALAIAVGGGRLAVLRLGTDLLLGDYRIMAPDGATPIDEIVRIEVDPSSHGDRVRIAAMSSAGTIACLDFDPNETTPRIMPSSLLPRPRNADASLQRGLAFIDGDLAVGGPGGVIEIHETGVDADGRWLVATEPTRRIETGLTGTISAVAPLPDGGHLVGTAAGIVAIVSDTGEPQTILAEASRMVTRVAVSPDHARFLACAGRSLLSGLLDGSSTRSIDAGGMIWDATFAPSSNRVAITSRDGCIRILSTEDWSELANIRETQGVTWSSLWDDGRLVVTTEKDGIISIPAERIEDAGGGGADSRLFALSPSTLSSLRQRDGGWIIRGRDDEVIAVHDGQDAGAIDPRKVLASSIRDLDADDDRQGLVAALAVHGRGLVGVDGRGRQHLLQVTDAAIREVHLAADGRRILWRTEQPSVHLGRFDTDGVFHHDRIEIPSERLDESSSETVSAASLFETESGHLLIACMDSRLHDPERDRFLRPFISERLDDRGFPAVRVGWLLSIAGDLDGVAFAGNHNGEISRWEARERIWLTESRRSMVVDLALHPDRHRLAALHSNGIIDILDTADGEVVATLGPIPGEPVRIAISPDGRTLTAHAADGRHRVWTTGTPATEIVVGR